MKNLCNSTSAASGESEAWTIFASTVKAKSHLIVPGKASTGFVAQISFLTVATAFIPVTAIAIIGVLWKMVCQLCENNVR